ncbi:MAG: Hpt domain-containing protein [Phycisphaerae bacterium]|nr:Hpt domain-containing protein [Phycisphaerae bacterium]
MTVNEEIILNHNLINWEVLESVYDADEEVLTEIAEVFCEEAPKSMEKIFLAISQSDRSDLKFYAHRMKGTLAAMGADSISKSAYKLERMAHDENIETVKELAGEISNDLSHLICFLRQPDWVSKINNK